MGAPTPCLVAWYMFWADLIEHIYVCMYVCMYVYGII
jgi:hypothetical protein